jgi:hypothetical protein
MHIAQLTKGTADREVVLNFFSNAALSIPRSHFLSQMISAPQLNDGSSTSLNVHVGNSVLFSFERIFYLHRSRSCAVSEISLSASAEQRNVWNTTLPQPQNVAPSQYQRDHWICVKT